MKDVIRKQSGCMLGLLLAIATPLSAESLTFKDWKLECQGTECAARSFKIEKPIEGYPSLKITGRVASKRKLIFADANIFDGSMPIRIQIDGNSLFHLSPNQDFAPLETASNADKASAYVIKNQKLQKEILLAMLKGGEMWVTYTNVRGQIRYPKYSLMGMTAALKALSN